MFRPSDNVSCVHIGPWKLIFESRQFIQKKAIREIIRSAKIIKNVVIFKKFHQVSLSPLVLKR